VLIVALGMIGATTQPVVRQGVSLIGGVALLVFGVLQLRDALKGPVESGSIASRLPGSSFFLGVIFTALNPFFIIWWLTIGSKLVIEGLVFASLAGVLLMYIAHVWMDYAFLGITAHLAKKGVQLTGSRGFRVLLAVFAVVLIYFGAIFMFSGF
jgi:threonine/homoserine/homoserine lactone efflux protein